MSLLNLNLLNQSDYVQDIYSTQTKTFSSIEYPYLIDIIKHNKIKTVLDIGTGEGDFIIGLAENLSDVAFTAIEGDKKLIDVANSKNKLEHLKFFNEVFDASYSKCTYDLILARFSVEHMNNTNDFVMEACKRLNAGGILLVTEYYCEYSETDNEHWKLFRKKEMELYSAVGSKPFTPLILPKLFKENGLKSVNSLFRHFTPSTIGYDEFYKTVISYTLGYSQIAPAVFTDSVKYELLEYFNNNKNPELESEDRLFVTHIMGYK